MSNIITVLAGVGDFKLSFDPNNPDEVAIAKKTFNDLKKKGMKAYVDTNSKSRRKEVEEFTTEHPKLVFTPAMVGGMASKPQRSS